MAVSVPGREAVSASAEANEESTRPVAFAVAVALRTSDTNLLWSIDAHFSPTYDIGFLRGVRRVLDLLPPTLTDTEKKTLVFFSVFLKPAPEGAWVCYSGMDAMM